MISSDIEARAQEIAHTRRLAFENNVMRGLIVRMATALGVEGDWCERRCADVFGCEGAGECPIEVMMNSLGIKDMPSVIRGKCHMEPSFTKSKTLEVQEFECSACGKFCTVEQFDEDEGPKFCPNCGRKVEE